MDVLEPPIPNHGSISLFQQAFLLAKALEISDRGVFSSLSQSIRCSVSRFFTTHIINKILLILKK